MSVADQVVTVSLACNDARNGSYVGHTEAVDFDAWPDGHHISLRGRRLRVVFSGRGGKSLRVGRRWFDGDNRARWVGNWCWDAVSMPLAEAKRLVAYLIERGYAVEEQTLGCPFLPEVAA